MTKKYNLKDFVPFDNYIRVDGLIVGASYFCKARNFSEGVWNGKNFDYIRTKFGDTFPATEEHWDAGPPFGTVKPLVKITGD